MLDQLRAALSASLTAHTVCVVSGCSAEGIWAQPVSYYSQGLTLYCQFPRWTDAAYYLEQPSRVVVIVPAANDVEQWLRCCGTARIIGGDQRILSVEVVAERLDLFDGARAWAVCETLEVC